MHLLSPSLQGLPAADDVDVDIILRRYLVHSLYDSPRGSYAAMVMNCAVIFSAWHVSQSQALFACFLGSAAIDFLRCGLIYTYARWPKPSQMPQHRVIFYRWSYQILSTVLYAILGTASYLLIAMEDAPSMALAVSITVGYAFASVARNSGQLSVFGAQVCCITIPAAIGFATASIPNGWTAQRHAHWASQPICTLGRVDLDARRFLRHGRRAVRHHHDRP